MNCPVTTSRRKRFYRPDWSNSPDCGGCSGCDGRTHQCHILGLLAACTWPVGITQDNHTEPWWYPRRDASLAERWLR